MTTATTTMATTSADCISWEDLHAQILALEEKGQLGDLFDVSFRHYRASTPKNNPSDAWYEPRHEWLKTAMRRFRGEPPYAPGHLHLASASYEDLISSGQLDFLFQMRTRVCVPISDLVARYGGARAVEVLTWLRDPDTGGGRCRWSESVCTAAMQAGPHAEEILLALRDPNTMGGRCPWGASTTYAALRHGGRHTEALLMLLRSSPEEMGGRCPWDALTFCGAVSKDLRRSENLMRLLRCRPIIMGGSCPWDAGAIKWAHEFGHAAAPALLRLLRSGELCGVCPDPEPDSEHWFDPY